MQWIKEHGPVDVLNSELVDEYVEATGMKFKWMAWGANVCQQLGRDLAFMAKRGALSRGRLGLGANWQRGFPKWVWSYKIGPASYLFEKEAI